MAWHAVVPLYFIGKRRCEHEDKSAASSSVAVLSKRTIYILVNVSWPMIVDDHSLPIWVACVSNHVTTMVSRSASQKYCPDHAVVECDGGPAPGSCHNTDHVMGCPTPADGPST